MNYSQYKQKLRILLAKRNRHLSKAKVHEESGNLAGTVAERERATRVDKHIEGIRSQGWEE